MRIGIDLGGVVVDRYPKGHPPASVDRYHLIPEHPNAVIVLYRITRRFGSSNVFLVSRASTEELERQIRLWLRIRDFFDRTNIPSGNLYICRERFEKVEIARRLGLTCFVDDRLEILAQMSESVRVFGFSPREDIREYPGLESRVTIVTNWSELESQLLI